MILIQLGLISTLNFLGNYGASGITLLTNSSNTTYGSMSDDKLLKQRGVDEPILDRDWERYLNELKRLKLHEMKKAIRSKVLSESTEPPFPISRIRRRLELLKLYDSENVELGCVENLEERKTFYRTASGQGILCIKIKEADEDRRDEKKIKQDRPIIVIVAGIGGSDWIAVHAVMHIVTNLVTSYKNQKLLGFDWWIIPLLNPDGYVTSMDNKLSRNYKSNINPTSGCWGVNLDRNFLLQRDTCHRGKIKINCQEHPGEFPFSEIESRALRDFISPQIDNCKLFVAVKEGAKALVYPFASSPSSPPGPHTVLQNLLCSEALEVFDEFHTGKKERFRFGNSGSIFGPSGGYVEDWARRHMGIPRSFAFYIADGQDRKNKMAKKLLEYGKGALEVIKVLATSRKFEPYANTFQELMSNRTKPHDLSKYPENRPVPWGRELIHKNLRDKINRGANLEMPVEFTRIAGKNRYENLDYVGEK